MEESTEIPSTLEVVITKDNYAIIGADYDVYDNYMKISSAIMIPREEVDPETNFQLDIHRLFEIYMGNKKNILPHIRVPYVNMRVQLSGYEPPQDLAEFLSAH